MAFPESGLTVCRSDHKRCVSRGETSRGGTESSRCAAYSASAPSGTAPRTPPPACSADRQLGRLGCQRERGGAITPLAPTETRGRARPLAVLVRATRETGAQPLPSVENHVRGLNGISVRRQVATAPRLLERPGEAARDA